MHQCLKVPELVGLVCSHLHSGDQGWVRNPSRRDLAVVARTCTAFFGPAIDVLWRSAWLVNLLCCLPPD
ncbi:hypothetical protein FB451DRAFT_422984 [Mycena latifolia]|nr:hypothetical protein FB451DRAFT_422984 [Mycena latifolia]